MDQNLTPIKIFKTDPHPCENVPWNLMELLSARKRQEQDLRKTIFFKGQKNRTQKSDSCAVFSPNRLIFGRFLNRTYFCRIESAIYGLCFRKVTWLLFRERLRFVASSHRTWTPSETEWRVFLLLLSSSPHRYTLKVPEWRVFFPYMHLALNKIVPDFAD